MDFENEEKQKLPKSLLITRVVGIILVIIGLPLLIAGIIMQLKSTANANFTFGFVNLIFTGIVLSTFGIFAIISSFISKINKAGLKINKYILEQNEQELKDLSKTGFSITKDVVSENKEDLSQIASDTGSILKEGFKAFKQENNQSLNKMYCKHCGKKIDSNSKFCSFCGKEQ